MSRLYLDSFLNSTLVEAVSVYWVDFVAKIGDSYSKLSATQSVSSVFDDIPDSLQFDEFQWYLLKAFTFILFLNLFCIFVAWRVYRKTVCDRFMKPVTSKAIEELKASVSRLKLPKEHTPRI